MCHWLSACQWHSCDCCVIVMWHCVSVLFHMMYTRINEVGMARPSIALHVTLMQLSCDFLQYNLDLVICAGEMTSVWFVWDSPGWAGCRWHPGSCCAQEAWYQDHWISHTQDDNEGTHELLMTTFSSTNYMAWLYHSHDLIIRTVLHFTPVASSY